MRLRKRMMNLGSYYPDGAEHDPNAPWNQKELDDIFDIDEFAEQAVKKFNEMIKKYEGEVIEGDIRKAFKEYYSYYLENGDLYSDSSVDFNKYDPSFRPKNEDDVLDFQLHLKVDDNESEKIKENDDFLIEYLEEQRVYLSLWVYDEFGSGCAVSMWLTISWEKVEGGYKFKSEIS